MTDSGDGGDRPPRALVVAIAAMAAVALLVGLAIAGALVVAVKVTGVGSAAHGSGASRPTLAMPKYHPTKSPAAGSDLPTPEPTHSAKQHHTRKHTAKPQKTKITLFAAPQKVPSGGRINLNGVYPDGEGVALQVQRKEAGRWTDFPVTAPVRGGAFDTWISTSHTGRNTLRVYDKPAHRGSNVVVVTVG